MAFEAVWRYLDSAELRFNFPRVSGIEPKVLNRLLAAPCWAERFWRRLGETTPTALDLGQADCTDLQRLSGLNILRWLNLSEMPIADLGPLRGLSNLDTLFCGWTRVSDLSPLAGLMELQHLVLNITPVSDLSPLAGLFRLKFLLLGNTSVSDLSPLAGLSGLETLWLDNTPVSDLSPLVHLAKLRKLSVTGVKAPVPEVLRQRPGLQIIGPSGGLPSNSSGQHRVNRRPE